MRGVSCKLAREHGLFKLLATFADPGMSVEDKSDMVRRIDEGVSPLFGGENNKSEPQTEEEEAAALENYFTRVIKAHRS